MTRLAYGCVLTACAVATLPGATVLAQCPAVQPLFASQVGGAATSVDIEGVIMVTHQGPSLRLYDITDANAPVLRGTLTLPETPAAIDLSGSLLLVVSRNILMVVDASNPSSPALLGSLAAPSQIGFLQSVARVGSVALLGGFNGAVRMSIADPANPILLGTTTYSLFGGPLVVSGDRALRWRASGQPELYQVGTQGELTSRGFLPVNFAGVQPAMGFVGVTAYVAWNSVGSVVVQRFTTTSASSFIYFSGPQVQVLPGVGGLVPLSMATSPNAQLYVSLSNGSLATIDGSGATMLTVANVLATSRPATVLALDGPRLAGARSLDTQVFSTSTPLTPQQGGALPVVGSVWDVGFNANVLVSVGDRIHCWSVADPASPQLLSQLSLPGFAAQTVDVVGNLAYLGGNDGVRIVDIANPAAPVVVASALPGLTVQELQVLGGQAYVGGILTSSVQGRLIVLDVTNPASPTTLSTISYASPFQWGGLAITSDRVIATSASSTTFVYRRLPNGTLAQLASSSFIGGDVELRASGGIGEPIVYLAPPSASISRYPVSPTGQFGVPLPVITLPLPANALLIEGPVLLAACSRAGVAFIDVDSAPAPLATCIVDTSDVAVELASNGTLVGVADAAGGVALIRWNRPACDSLDFNNDGIQQDPTDIAALLSVYAGGACVPGTATCNDVDFNNDGIEQDPTDIEAFLSVYSGGPCF